MRATFSAALLGTMAFHLGKCMCPASSGNSRPRQQNGSYEFYDPDACNCTAWVPKPAAKARVAIKPLETPRTPDPKPKPPPDFGCAKHHVIKNAPWGLAFFGMSLSQRHSDVPTANQASVTHQNKLDFNRLQDRASEYLCQMSDDGWLAGGGSGKSSFFLPNIDSANIEFVRPGSICSSLSVGSALQPDTSSYSKTPTFITGAPLGVLIDRVRSRVAFDEIRVTPTGAPAGDNVTLRFNPEDQNGTRVNPTMLLVWEKLVHEFYDVQVLDKSDPFHVQVSRDMHFCTNESHTKFFESINKLTIQPWIEWATQHNGKLGVVLNDEIPQYKDKAGGFYLFVTRNRPLIYFAPDREGRHAKGSRAYYCEWKQDGKVITFANPVGGPVTETLVEIPSNVKADDFINQNEVLHRMSNGLCNDYSYQAMPEAEWTPGQMLQSVVV